jgi:hypothetical protein
MASVAQEAHLPALEHHGREEAGRELQATLVELVDLPDRQAVALEHLRAALQAAA